MRLRHSDSTRMTDAKKIKRLYDEYFSKTYDQHMHATNHYATMAKVIAQLRQHFGVRILDPCCGTGEPLLMIRELFKDDPRMLIANDFSAGMLEKARKKLEGSGVMPTTSDVMQMHFPDKSIPTIFCSY